MASAPAAVAAAPPPARSIGRQRARLRRDDRAIVHVVEAFGGGLFETMRVLASYSAAAGMRTIVIHGVRPETPDDPAVLFHPAVRLVRVEGWGARDPIGALRSGLGALKVVKRELARYPGGVLHLHSSLAGFAGRLLPVGSRWAVYYTAHGYGFLNPLYKVRSRAFILAAEGLLGRRGRTIAISRAEANTAALALGPDRVTLVRLGVPLPAVVSPPPAGPITVMAVGRATGTRRPEEFADVAMRLGDLGLDFVWVGDGPDRRVLEEAGVRVAGWLSQEDASAAYGAAHVVLHLSALEGLPRALLEAMAAGRAVVASDIPPVREALGDAGILVQDAAEAAAAVRRLVVDPRAREQVARQARERAERLFSAEAMACRWVAAYGLGDR